MIKREILTRNQREVNGKKWKLAFRVPQNGTQYNKQRFNICFSWQ